MEIDTVIKKDKATPGVLVSVLLLGRDIITMAALKKKINKFGFAYNSLSLVHCHGREHGGMQEDIELER